MLPPKNKHKWLRGQDLNLRPSGYEPDELPGCSTPRYSRTYSHALLRRSRTPDQRCLPFGFAGTIFGGSGGTRTRTDSRPRDFKSLVSTVPPRSRNRKQGIVYTAFVCLSTVQEQIRPSQALRKLSKKQFRKGVFEKHPRATITRPNCHIRYFMLQDSYSVMHSFLPRRPEAQGPGICEKHAVRFHDAARGATERYRVFRNHRRRDG